MFFGRNNGNNKPQHTETTGPEEVFRKAQWQKDVFLLGSALSSAPLEKSVFIDIFKQAKIILAGEDRRFRKISVYCKRIVPKTDRIMEYEHQLKEYAPSIDEKRVAELVAQAQKDAPKNQNAEVYKTCFGSIDLTTLTETDSDVSVERFVSDAVALPRKHGVPHVASICVFPTFVDTVGLGVEGTEIGVTSVAGGFPSSQTFLEVKMLEVSMAVENGADEIDVVINVGEMLQGEYNQMANDLEMLRHEAGEDIIFKVILETASLRSAELIRRAALLAMFAGADFVKTSTGKNSGGATPEAAVTMCLAIEEYYKKTGRKVGFKAAGGIRTAEDAALYYTIVENILGKEWLNPSLFRLGASALADNLIEAICATKQQ